MVGCSYSFKDSICVHVYTLILVCYVYSKVLSPENKKRLRRLTSQLRKGALAKHAIP